MAEDVQEHLRPTSESIPGNRAAAPDTLLRKLKGLATEDTIVTSSSGKEYRFNINEKMNDLNIKSLLLTGQPEKGKKYDSDYDSQIIEYEKRDAGRICKHTTQDILRAQARQATGSSTQKTGTAMPMLSKTAQGETPARMFGQLRDDGITINRSRTDAGSYAKYIADTVSKNCGLSYIRADKSESMTEQISRISEWKKAEINYKTYGVASIPVF